MSLFNVGAEVYEAVNFELMESIVMDHVDSETLVLFDVDDVLIKPTQDYLFRHPIRKMLLRELRSRKSKEQMDQLFTDFFQRRQVELVDHRILGLLNKLECMQVTATAFTAWWTGSFGDIPMMEVLRMEGLEQVGISFDTLSPLKENHTFIEFDPKPSGYPMVYEKILITGQKSKAEVLKKIWNYLGLDHHNIIFIDDDLTNLKEVGSVVKSHGIDYIGIHYTQAINEPIRELNDEREKQRFTILEEKGVWLREDELDDYLAQ